MTVVPCLLLSADLTGAPTLSSIIRSISKVPSDTWRRVPEPVSSPLCQMTSDTSNAVAGCTNRAAAQRPMTKSSLSCKNAYPQLLGEGECGEDRELLAVLEAIVLQRLQQPLEVVLQVLDEERPPPDELLDKAHVHQDARLGRLCREEAEGCILVRWDDCPLMSF
jgi:hypothetical protein